jgi:hypothetical protein
MHRCLVRLQHDLDAAVRLVAEPSIALAASSSGRLCVMTKEGPRRARSTRRRPCGRRESPAGGEMRRRFGLVDVGVEGGAVRLRGRPRRCTRRLRIRAQPQAGTRCESRQGPSSARRPRTARAHTAPCPPAYPRVMCGQPKRPDVALSRARLANRRAPAVYPPGHAPY